MGFSQTIELIEIEVFWCSQFQDLRPLIVQDATLVVRSSVAFARSRRRPQNTSAQNPAECIAMQAMGSVGTVLDCVVAGIAS